MISDSEWNKAVEALQASSEIAVACHINPDGDALGSMLGLGRFLARQNKKLWMGWGSGTIQLPPQYEFLPGVGDLVSHEHFPEVIQTFVAIDCADIQRLGLLRPRFEAAQIRINIDHHVSNEGFGNINLVDPSAASSSELAFELIRRMGGRPDPDEATCLYTGIVTDTGRFQYASTSPTTLRTAAELREIGIDHEKVGSQVYESNSFGYLHVLGLVLSRARLEDGMVWSWLDQDDLGGLDLDETENFIDTLRTVAEAKVAVLLKQWPKRAYKASLRSKGDVDVAQIAKSLGGGGHERAAGFEMRGSVEEVINAIKERLPRE